MKELSEKIQLVINTLEGLDIKSTFDNMNRLLGSLQALAEIRDALGAEVKVVPDEQTCHYHPPLQRALGDR